MKQGKRGNQKSKNLNQIVAIVLGCFCGFNNGLMLAWPSPFILKITNDKENYDITTDQASYFSVFPSLGMLVSGLAFFKLNDAIGRRNTLLLLTIPQLTFWVITIFSRDIYVLYFARFVSGMSDAALFASLPIYIGEIATPRVRGVWGNLQTFFYGFGIFAINVIGSYMTVKTTAYLCVCLPVIFIIFFSRMPESPYYYMMKGRFEEAKESLQWLRKEDNVEHEFIQIKADVERQISESGTWKDLFTIETNVRALIVAIFLRLAQHLAGGTVMQLYTQLIFEMSGTNIGPEISAIIFTGLLTAINPISMVLLDRFGRRKSFMVSCFFTAVTLLIYGVYLYLNDFVSTVNLDSVRWIPLAVTVAWIVVISLGLGQLPTLMIGELFSASIKTKAVCIYNLIFALSYFFNSYIFNVFIFYVGMYFPFMVYAALTFVNAVLAYYIMPETKGRTLEQIQQHLKMMRFIGTKRK
ncbi:facilitated trehalose transporter Tret1-like [Cylas formicarius]|uniref:facilitated trehalose transporter Tret1-like n=1 Tax=Cylas formicarius TaxID=197179 RepID=UPI002958CF9C|nr:facilitated trehalose transporter Tret1-like [Cylas formicarius]XP_060518615.1 facilitated trehalose transporter Tret1-like [Cylas formicarius]